MRKTQRQRKKSTKSTSGLEVFIACFTFQDLFWNFLESNGALHYIFPLKKAQSNLTRVVVYFRIKFWPSVLNTDDSLQFEWVKSSGIKSGAAAPQLRGYMKDAGSHVWVPPRQLPRCHMPLPWGEHRETPYWKQLHFAHEGGMNFSLT